MSDYEDQFDILPTVLDIEEIIISCDGYYIIEIECTQEEFDAIDSISNSVAYYIDGTE